MALVKFVFGGETKTARMGAPRKVYSLEHWLKAARKKIPTIPDWAIETHAVTKDEIVLILKGSCSTIAKVIIDRRVPSIGGL